jgi:hypothetical protein
MKQNEENADVGLAILRKHAVVGKANHSPNPTPEANTNVRASQSDAEKS